MTLRWFLPCFALLVCTDLVWSQVGPRPKKIYAHYMGCFPVASGPIGCWRSREHETDLRSDDPVRAMGGRFRNWPLVPPATRLNALESAELDIHRAIRAGFDGFALDAWAGHQSKEVLAALFMATWCWTT